MITKGKIGLLAGVAALAVSASWPAYAQDQNSTLTLDELKARLEALEAEVQQSEIHQADASSAPAPASAHVAETAAHKLSLVSADGQYSIGLTGRVMIDAGGYPNFEPDSKLSGPQRLSSGLNARRARIGITGKLAGDWTYTFIYDGGGSTDSPASGIQTAQISYTGWKGVIIDLPGYSEPAFTLDTATSSNDIMFLERAVPVNVATNVNTGDFRANTGIRIFGDRYWLGAYFTGPMNGNSHSNVLENFGAFQRATVQALVGDNYSLHLGFGIDELLSAPDSGVGTAKTITLSDRPELRIDPTQFVSTGALGSVAHPVQGATIYNPEVAFQYGPFYTQGEYFHYDVERGGLKDANFDGGYLQAAYTLTGEHRSYNPTTGAYSSITPAHPFSLKDGNWGAWEIAARWSYINLNDQFIPGTAISTQPNAVDGGQETGITVGVNWYVNTYLRFMVNYVHTDFDKANPTAIAASGGQPGVPLGGKIGDKIDSVGFRTQFAW